MQLRLTEIQQATGEYRDDQGHQYKAQAGILPATDKPYDHEAGDVQQQVDRIVMD